MSMRADGKDFARFISRCGAGWHPARSRTGGLPYRPMCYSTRVIPFRLTFEPGISLYEQVVYAAKKAVVSGQMRPGDPFPSVRALSKALKINPNTAHKVITHLVAEGLIEVRSGVGTVVSELAASPQGLDRVVFCCFAQEAADHHMAAFAELGLA